MSAKGKAEDQREGESEEGEEEDEGSQRRGEEKKDLGLHSRLGRPGWTNAFDSPEINFPVVKTAAKYVKPFLQSQDRSMSKTDKI